MSTYSTGDLSVQVCVPHYVSTSTPTFVWNNSTDADGDTISYHLQLAPNGIWSDSGVINETGIALQSGATTSHTLVNHLTQDVIYSWRLRAWDGYEFSDWSSALALIYAVNTQLVSDIFATTTIIRSGYVDLPAQTTITVAGYSDIFATTNLLIPGVDFPAEIFVIQKGLSDLAASVTVQRQGSNDLMASLVVEGRSSTDLSASISVSYYSYENLSGNINVLVRRSSDLSSSIQVSRKTTNDLTANLNIVSLSYWDLNAQMNVCEYNTSYLFANLNIMPRSDLPASLRIWSISDLSAQIFIEPTSDLLSSITILPRSDLSASIRVEGYSSTDLQAVMNVSTASQLPADITIFSPSDLMGQIRIDAEYQKLYATMNVCAPAGKDLAASLNIIRDSLLASIMVIQPQSTDLYAQMDVCAYSTTDLMANLFVSPATDLPAYLYVLSKSYGSIAASMTVISDKPTDISISAKDNLGNAITQGVWQASPNIIYNWTTSSDNFYAVAYYTALNTTPNYVVTEVDTNVGYVKAQTVALPYAGAWWFHVRAINAIGNFSPDTAHFLVDYNHPPTAPLAPFTVDGVVSGTLCSTYSSTPIFKWGNATDIDPGDSKTYELQIATDVDFTQIQVDVAGIIENPFINLTSYQLVLTNRITSPGIKYWRVRATDGKQYGAWAFAGQFDVLSTTTDIMAQIGISEPSHTNLPATLSIIPYLDIPATITVHHHIYSDLAADLTVARHSDTDFYASIIIPTLVDLPAQLKIKPKFDLPASMTVERLGGSSLSASIMVDYYVDVDLPAKLKVSLGSSVELQATIGVEIVRDLSAQIRVWSMAHLPNWEDLPVSINVEQKLLLDLPASMQVSANKPGGVIVTCNIPEGVWQSSQTNAIFTWSPAQAGFFPVTGYYVVLDKNPNTIPGPSDQKWIGLTKTYVLEDAGAYWFHIAAVNSNYVIGPVSHYNVDYNHAPTAPGSLMLVNGSDSLGARPIIGLGLNQIFYWNSSTDVDANDILTYTLQISSSENFDTVLLELTGIPSNTTQIATSQTVTSGTYYWRVLGNDGHQNSDWSHTASFIINTPPPTPTDLYVISS